MKKTIVCSLIALALVAGLLTGCGEAAGVVGMMSIDVNPGIELVFDENHKVIKLTAANEDANEVIGEIDYTGAGVEDVAETLLYRLALEGYLTGDTSNILLSVDDSLLSKTALEKVKAALEGPLATINSEAALVARVYGEADSEILETAHESGLTMGKYMLLQGVAEEYDLELDDLMDVTLRELLGYAGGLPEGSLYSNDLYGGSSSSSTSSTSGTPASSHSDIDYPNDSPNTTNYTPNDTPNSPAPIPSQPGQGGGSTDAPNDSPNTTNYTPNDTPNTPAPTPDPAPAPAAPAPTPPPADSGNSPASPSDSGNSPAAPNDSGNS